MPKLWNYMENFKNDCLKYKSENTISGYMTDLKLFKDFLQDDFENVTRENIEKYKRYLQEKGSRAVTINRKLVSIRRFIEYLEKMNPELKFNFEIVSVAIQRDTGLKNLLTYQEFKQIVKAAEDSNDKRAVAIFYCLCLTGLRVSEMLSLKVKDISKEIIYIWGKGNKERPLKLKENLKIYLNEYIQERNHQPDSSLFINIYTDKSMTRYQVHTLIKKYASKTNVKRSKAHAHNFRHLFAIRLKATTSIDSIGMMLGHRDINYTKIYTKESLEATFANNDKVEDD